MGCSQKREGGLKTVLALAPGGPEFPDVSNWQGVVNWPLVRAWQHSHGWRAVAIFKLGEYRPDAFASLNARQTAKLGFWRAGYWFVRNTGCTHEGGQIIQAAHVYGLKVVVEDTEVPEAAGYASCLAPQLHRAGLIVVEYSAPGTNPDGSRNPGLPIWVASYGPSHPPCLFTCRVGAGPGQTIVAFQFTDGQFGSVVNVPGIGHDDVSVDYGITKLGTTPPNPICFTRHETRAACTTVKARMASDQRALAATQRVLVWDRGILGSHRCVKPYRRAICVTGGRINAQLSQRWNYFFTRIYILKHSN